MSRMHGALLKNSVCSARFVIAVLAYLGMLLWTNVTTDDAPMGQCALIQLFPYYQDAYWLETDSFYWRSVWFRLMLESYHLLFLPILAAFPSVILFCDSLSSGNFRFSLSRSSFRRWIGAQVSSTLLTAALMVLSAQSIIAVLCWSFFPHADAPFQLILYPKRIPDHALQTLLMMLNDISFILLYVLAIVLVILIAAALFRSPFPALCLPMVFQFLADQYARQITSQNLLSMPPREDIRAQFFSLQGFAYPHEWFPKWTGGHSVWWLLIPYAMVFCIGILLFFVVVRRRVRQ